jgi:hypothetical protein
MFNPLNAELNPIRHLLALAGAHHFVHVSRIRVKIALCLSANTVRGIQNVSCFLITHYYPSIFA